MKKRDINMTLIKVAEECAEVTQMVSKIIYNGLDSISPKPSNHKKQTNRDLLIEEIGDVLANIKILVEYTNAKIHWDGILARRDEKVLKLMNIIPEDENVNNRFI